MDYSPASSLSTSVSSTPFAAAVNHIVEHIARPNVRINEVSPTIRSSANGAVTSGVTLQYQMQFLLEVSGYNSTDRAVLSAVERLNAAIHTEQYPTLVNAYAEQYGVDTSFVTSNVTYGLFVVKSASTQEISTNTPSTTSTDHNSANNTSALPLYATILLLVGGFCLLALLVVIGLKKCSSGILLFKDEKLAKASQAVSVQLNQNLREAYETEETAHVIEEWMERIACTESTHAEEHRVVAATVGSDPVQE
jgi:hypothetical protein